MGVQSHDQIGIFERKGILFCKAQRFEIAYDGWPRLEATVRCLDGDDWRPCLPYLDLESGFLAPWAFLSEGVPVTALRRQDEACESVRWMRLREKFAGVRCYFSNVPDDVACSVKPFVHRQWQLLRFAAEGGSAASRLLAEMPILAFCVAVRTSLLCGTNDGYTLRQWLQFSPRKICHNLGFPAPKKSLEVLAKIPKDVCRPADLLLLRKRLSDPECRRVLKKLPVINGNVLRLLRSHFHDWVSAKLFSQVASDPAGYFVREGLERVCTDYERLVKMKLPVKRFCSLDDIEYYLSKMELVLERELWQGLPPFPVPPLAGLDAIRPITTPFELYQECKSLKHWAVDYCEGVAEGVFYLYSVFTPERSTLIVYKSPQGWKLFDLIGFLGQPIQGKCREAVNEWLSTVR